MVRALETILDRESPRKQVEEHFGKQLDVLRDMVNYGTKLVPRCLESSQKTACDLILLGVFVKQFVGLLDSAEINISQGAVLASSLPARALYEMGLYIEWMLKADTERRAKQYYVWELRQRRRWASRIIPGTPENISFESSMEKLSLYRKSNPNSKQEFEKLIEEARKQIPEIDNLLKSPTYAEVNAEFDRIKKRDFDKPWYSPSGVGSIQQIAKSLKKGHEYDFVYSRLSDVTHGTVLKSHLVVGLESISLEPIRNLRSIDLVLQVSYIIAMRIYKMILEKYRDAELKNLISKYEAEWRPSIMSIKSVAYSVDVAPVS